MVNYEYYANGWLKNVKKENSLIAAYIYDNVGNRTVLTYGNNSEEHFAYEAADPRYRLSGIDYYYKCDANSIVESHGGLKFTRDNSGNPLTWGDKDNKYTKSYEYDDNSRLKSANYPGKGTTEWSYDWVGNRTGSSYEYNDADQLTASPDKSYEYYDNGNLHQINTDEKVFDYTYNNLVSAIQHDEGPSSSMVWDSGNRISFTSSTGGTYKYLYDPTAGVPAVIEEVLPSNVSIHYVREPNGALLARISGATTQYYHFDELGSTLFLTDSYAVVSDRYTYDAWGNVGNTNQPYQYVGQLGYYTHYQDINLPYIQTGVRLYNPEIGRYMQRDVKKEFISHYVYINNRSTLFVDPNGTEAIFACWYNSGLKGGKAAALGHAWLCWGKECYGCYPSVNYPWPVGTIGDDSGLMKKQLPGVPDTSTHPTAECRRIDTKLKGEKKKNFEACMKRNKPKDGDKCSWTGGTNCSSYVMDSLINCGALDSCQLQIVKQFPTITPDILELLLETLF